MGAGGPRRVDCRMRHPKAAGLAHLMGELETERDALEHFVASGRAGRRNALPEIEVESNDPGAAKLAERLSDLSAHCDDESDKHSEQQSAPQPQTASS